MNRGAGKPARPALRGPRRGNAPGLPGKSGLTPPRAGAFLPGGSYYSYLTGAGGRWCLKARVIEYHVTAGGQDVPEMFCLITGLHDYAAYPAAQLAGAYARRWAGSGTALKEAKPAIAGAGPSAGAILRPKTPELIDQEHAAWICGTELARALARAAARQAAPARKDHLAGQKAQPRQISFTAARRAALDSTSSGAATASLPIAITAAMHHSTLHDLGKRRIVTGRHRHRKTRTRQAFPAAGRYITTRTAAAQVSVCGRPPPDRRGPPSPSPVPARNRRMWNRPPVRERHPGHTRARHSPQPPTRTITPRPERRDERCSRSSPWHWRRGGVTLHGWPLAWWAARRRLNGPKAKDGRRTLLRARQGSRQLIASWELDVDDRRPFVRQPWRLPSG